MAIDLLDGDSDELDQLVGSAVIDQRLIEAKLKARDTLKKTWKESSPMVKSKYKEMQGTTCYRREPLSSREKNY